jgi:hypothetical protein
MNLGSFIVGLNASTCDAFEKALSPARAKIIVCKRSSGKAETFNQQTPGSASRFKGQVESHRTLLDDHTREPKR